VPCSPCRPPFSPPRPSHSLETTAQRRASQGGGGGSSSSSDGGGSVVVVSNINGLTGLNRLVKLGLSLDRLNWSSNARHPDEPSLLLVKTTCLHPFGCMCRRALDSRMNIERNQK